jgi:hydroxymethylpyrimidine/phosphomethylpyrimidine kinase
MIITNETFSQELEAVQETIQEALDTASTLSSAITFVRTGRARGLPHELAVLEAIDSLTNSLRENLSLCDTTLLRLLTDE